MNGTINATIKQSSVGPAKNQKYFFKDFSMVSSIKKADLAA
jgi:hypothetical protein